MFIGVLAVLSSGALLTACGEEPSNQSTPSHSSTPELAPPAAPTVAYFLEHADELRATLEACRNDPGSLRSSPACVNAVEASRQKLSREIDQALE